MYENSIERKVNELIEELYQIGLKNIEKIDGTTKHFMTGEIIPNIILKDVKIYPFCIPGGLDGRDDGVEPRVKEIGQELFDLGGLRFMQYAYYELRKKLGPVVRTVNAAWDGIGTWEF